MRITPLDIQQKKFPKKMKGYDSDDVKSFLELIGEELAELLKENTNMKEEARRISNQLKEYTDLEAALRDTLMKSQEFVDTYIANARKDCELVQKKAELKADEILKESKQTIAQIHSEINDLKGIRKHFKEEMKKLIESNLEKV